MFKYKEYGKRLLHNTLISLVTYSKPKSYLEIGVREGHSLEAVLSGNSVITRLVLCDTWGGHYGGTGRGNHNHIQEILDCREYDGEVKFLDGDSQYMIPTLNEKFDLILVDGDHSYDGAYTDLINAWIFLKEGGFIVFDDIVHNSHAYLHDCVMTFAKTVGAEIFYENFDDNGVVILKRV
jgi:predicted O-methyltransferase YrrM